MTDESGRRMSPDRAIHAGMQPLNHKKVGIQSSMPKYFRSASSTIASAKYDTALSGFYLWRFATASNSARCTGLLT